MASNLTAYTAIPDGMPATPSNMNSRLSQLQLNSVSVATIATDIISGTTTLAANSVGSVQIASSAIIGSKIATSVITTRSLANASVTSLKIADGAVTTADLATDSVTSLKVHASVPSELSFTESTITTKRIIVTDAGTAAVGDPLGNNARFKAEGIFWELTQVVGPGSEGTVGIALADTNSGPAGAYRQPGSDNISTTSLPELALFSGNTTYMLAHSAGLIISNSSAPTGKGSGRTGDIRWASGFIYVCSSTSSWERAALSRF